MSKNQDYDKIIRSNLEKVLPSILDKLCGLRPPKLQDLPTSFQRARERRPDFLKKALHIDPIADYLLHIEFQSGNDPNMLCRMLDMYAMMYAAYKLPARQFVIYIGSERLNMTATLNHHPALKYQYQLIDIQDIDFEVFLGSDKPEEIILAILANFKGQSSVIALRSILNNLQRCVRNAASLQKYIIQLEILSNLRKLQPLILELIETMPITYDITTDLRYQQGIEQGIEKGIEQGIEKGIEQGIEQGIEAHARQTIEALLRRNIFDISEIAEIANTSVEFVLKVQKEWRDKLEKEN